jgi:hypothetical protein
MWMTGLMPQLFHHLPGQTDAEPHPDANHRQGKSGIWGKGKRADRRLYRRVPRLAKSARRFTVRHPVAAWKKAIPRYNPKKPWWRN